MLNVRNQYKKTAWSLFVGFLLLALGGCGPTDPSATYVTLTVEVNGAGAVTPNGGTYIKDYTVTLQAVPNAGYKFDRWEGALTGSTNPAMVKVSDNITVRAYFISTASHRSPTAFNLTVTTTKNTPVNFDLAGEDPDGLALTYTTVTGPQYGNILTINLPSVTYNPGVNPNGLDSLTYKVSDMYAQSDPAKVFLNVIDGSLTGLAKTFGSTGSDRVYAMATDTKGNFYLTGSFSDVVDFDPGSKNSLFRSAGLQDIFLAKFSPVGEFIWVRTIGGAGNDFGMAVCTDSADNVYLAGNFPGTIVIDAATGTNLASRGGTAIAICKFSSDRTFQWARAIDGLGNESVFGLVMDNLNNLYAAGSFSSSIDFNNVDGHDQRVSKGLADGFITRMDGDGKYFWTGTFGSTLDDAVTALTTEPTGDLYAAGYYSGSIDLDPGDGIDTVASAGGSDVFVMRINSAGQRIWKRIFGGTGQDQPLGITSDFASTLYVCGMFQQSVNFNGQFGGSDTHSSSGDYDAFVTTFASSGVYGWTRTFGGTGKDFANGVAVDVNSNAYATGGFTGQVDFDFTPTVDKKSSTGLLDVYVTKITASGGYTGTATVGGTGDDVGYTITVNNVLQCLYWAGSFQQTANLDPRLLKTENHGAFGNDDCFVEKTDFSLSW